MTSKTSNACTHSKEHIQEKISSYTAMPTAGQKILSASWNVQFVAFITSENKGNNKITELQTILQRESKKLVSM
jgi:hypothetical protein